MKPIFAIAVGVIAIVTVLVGTLRWKESERVAMIVETNLLAPPSAMGLHPELARRIKELNQRIVDNPNAIDSLGKLSRLYHANGYLNDAWQAYRILIEVDGENPLWHHRLASIVSSYGQLEDALALYVKASELDPSYLPTRLHLGDAYLKLNKDKEAESVFESILKEAPKNAFALFGLARVSLARSDQAQAKTFLESARRSNSRIGGDLLADLYEELGETAKARSLLHEVNWSSHVDVYDPWVDDLVSDCYDSFEVAMAGGKAGRAGDTDKAIRLLKRATTLDPLDQNALNHLAENYLTRGDIEQARETYDRCTKIAPTFWEGWSGLISIEVNAGNHAQASEIIDQALVHCPNSYVINNYKGDALITENRAREAIPYFEKTIQLVPENAVGYNYLARAYVSLGQSAKAHEQLQKALKAEPSNPLALKLISLYYIVEGEKANAEEHMDRAYRSPRFSEEDLQRLQAMFNQRFQ